MNAKALLNLLPVDWLASTSINMAEKVLDNAVDGSELSATEIKIIRSGYFEAQNWLTDVVESSKNSYDNQGLEAFLRQCEDTAEEGGFALPFLEPTGAEE